MYVLATPLPEDEPPSSIATTERDAYKKYINDVNETSSLMLATMNSELQKQHEKMEVFDMIEHTKVVVPLTS